MSEKTKAVVFAAILSITCCVLITAACTGLQKYQKINAELDRQINVIKSVGLVKKGASYTKEDIGRLYSDHIVEGWVGDSGDLTMTYPEKRDGAHPLFLYKEKNTLAGYIIPMNVRGLWGRIKGYLALERDGETIKGFTVFNHQETPGLGGEIESTWFQNNFIGKKIVDDHGGFVSVSVAKGSVKDSIASDKQANYVDGISGATLTGNYLTQGFEKTLKTFEPLSKRFRTDGSSGIRFKE